MKSLNKLTHADKAKLLYILFPEEIPKLIDFIFEYGKNRSLWNLEHIHQNNAVINMEFWSRIASEIKCVVQSYQYDMLRSKTVFSEQLTYNYRWIYFNECLLSYMRKRCQSKKFRQAVKLLYKKSYLRKS